MSKDKVLKNDERIEFIRCFPDVCISTLDEILEHCSDKDWLNEKGLKFKTKFWELFIKE